MIFHGYVSLPEGNYSIDKWIIIMLAYHLATGTAHPDVQNLIWTNIIRPRQQCNSRHFWGRLTVTFPPLGKPRPEHELLLLVPFGVPGRRLLRGGPVTFVSSQGRLMPAVLIEAGRNLVLQMVMAWADNMKPAFIDAFSMLLPWTWLKYVKIC